MENISTLLQALLDYQIISANQCEAIKAARTSLAPSISYHLIQSQIISSQNLFKFCLSHFSANPFDPAIHVCKPQLLSEEFVVRYRSIPFITERNEIYIGLADPTDQQALNYARFEIGLPVNLLLMNETDVQSHIRKYYTPNINTQLKQTLAQLTPIAEPEESLAMQYNDEPVIKFVDQLLTEAIEQHISDIHIEPFQHYCRVRFRRDGMLYEAANLPGHLAARVITRIKVLAELNIAERRLPQEGRIHHSFQKIDLRLSVCPTIHGEKIVLRILENYANLYSLNELGLLPEQYLLLLDCLKRPHGLIFVAGPTGCGKTMTLYSLLNHLNVVEKNICTIEDPVEIELPGITQINVNAKIGLDFAQILQGLLRQDPDIIMIGEIRNLEVAKIALQAAQTGHLVLATLHTNSAAETFQRLQTLGVPLEYSLNSINLIISQRLVRKLCNRCKGTTCQFCRGGFFGRIGIFELLPINSAYQSHLYSLPNAKQIAELLKTIGQPCLREAGDIKISAGLTTMTELLHVCPTTA